MDLSVNKYYFRVKRYLRNLGLSLDKFHVQLENDAYIITEWDYPNHPQPTLEMLRSITDAEVSDEISKTLTPSYTRDIYTIESHQHENIQITPNRQNYCSTVLENQIHLNRVGFYRITASGKQVVEGFTRTEFNFTLAIGDELPVIISTKVFLASSSFNFITFIKVDTLSKLSARIKLQPTHESCEFRGYVLVELM